MNGHGGKRPGSGRKPGSTTRAKLDLMQMAKDFAPDALETLSEIQKDKTQPAAARVSAAIAILDRGYGKPTQALSGPDGGPIEAVSRIVIEAATDGDSAD